MNVSECVKCSIAICGLFITSAFSQEVYRCGNSYSATPCKDAVIVDVSPAVSNPDGPLTTYIYLCKRPDISELWWIPSSCESRGWTIVDREKVPSNVDFKTQLSIAKRQRADAAKKANQNRSWSHAQNTQTQRQTQSSCEYLNQRVEWLDAAGRAGGTVRRMEWIREERKNARDQQFRDRC